MLVMNVEVERLRPNARLPEYKTAGAAGMDLYACLERSVRIYPGCHRVIGAGIAVAIPEGWEIQVRPRSGLALKNGITVLNAPGTIDSDYRGEIGALLINHSQETFVVNDGDRIAQLVIAQAWRMSLKVVGELPSTERGGGGFGSTGV